MCMFSERLQILVSPEQRRRLELEAERRGTSVAALIRDAVDAAYGAVTAEERAGAVRAIAGMEGRYLSPQELDRAAEAERAGQLPR